MLDRLNNSYIPAAKTVWTVKPEISINHLPLDVLKTMMEFLPSEDIWALHLVEKKNIFCAAQQVITNRSQKFLENLACDLLQKDRDIVLNFKKRKIKKKYQFFKEQAETFPAGTEKRCESLRKAICSLFENYADGSHLTLQYCLNDFNFYEDKFLPIRLTKNVQLLPNNSMQVVCSDKYVKTCGSFFNILKENQLKAEYLILERVTLDKKILDLLLETFRENQSIQKVSLLMDQWKPLDLKQVLGVINNNERINMVGIRDNAYYTEMAILLRKMEDLSLFGDSLRDSILGGILKNTLTSFTVEQYRGDYWECRRR